MSGVFVSGVVVLHRSSVEASGQFVPGVVEEMTLRRLCPSPMGFLTFTL
ncbi:hypothetical protein [Amycolatopsis rubida]|nr:hypothetical protein [Amycolatopsis rubida]